MNHEIVIFKTEKFKYYLVLQNNTMQTITFKLNNEILKKIDNSLTTFNFSTRTEFIRDAIRSKLTALEKEEAIKKLAAFKGSLKGKSKLSDEEAREKAAKKIAARFGVKLD